MKFNFSRQVTFCGKGKEDKKVFNVGVRDVEQDLVKSKYFEGLVDKGVVSYVYSASDTAKESSSKK
jgi:hypothetical protein